MREFLNQRLMLESLRELNKRATASSHLIIGGGAALILAYSIPLVTDYVDAFVAKGGLSLEELDAASKDVAKKLNTQPDWLNSHFITFTHVLPVDYATRLRNVFQGKRIRVDALGPEDILVMKCFAGRDKDRPHALKLICLANLDIVDRHLAYLVGKRIPGVTSAADFFDDLRDEAEA